MHTYHLTTLLLNIATYEINAALDMIVDHGNEITAFDAQMVMEGAARIDRTFSNDGAAIRDALRNNTELTIN